MKSCSRRMGRHFEAELKATSAQWWSKLRAAEEAGTVATREAVDARRAELVALSAARTSAEAECAVLHRQLAEQAAATERLRECRNGSTLERLRVLEMENRELKQRRRANNRTISEANLDRRRAQVAQVQVQQAKQALGEDCVRDHAQATPPPSHPPPLPHSLSPSHPPSHPPSLHVPVGLT